MDYTETATDNTGFRSYSDLTDATTYSLLFIGGSLAFILLTW
jgi:hypothetical protein